MDQNEILNIETSRKSNKYYLFIKKTLQFLVPVSLVSFLLSCTSGFFFFFTYNFHFSTLVFPLFSHAIERKYMFLICNGILAFLAKTLRFGSAPPPVSDFVRDQYSMKITEDSSKLVPENVGTLVEEQEEYPSLEGELEDDVYTSLKTTITLAEDELKTKKVIEDENGIITTENEGKQVENSLIIESEDIEGEQEDDTEDDGTLPGASEAEAANEVRFNTEELNKKFEEFIRKMKEEIRIEAQQQILAV